MRSSVGLAVGGLALAAAMAGCGSSGGNGVQKTVARVACLSRAEAVGQTNVVRAAFASGDVASPAYLRTRVFGKSVPRSAYLDAQGRLKPLLAMPREAQDEFLGW